LPASFSAGKIGIYLGSHGGVFPICGSSGKYKLREPETPFAGITFSYKCTIEMYYL